MKLEQNYRSTQTVVNASNALISHNEGQMEKYLFSEKEVGSKVRTIQTQNEYTEAAYIAARIKQLIMQEDYEYGDFAILYRSSYQSRAIEEVFRKNLFPYTIVGGTAFMDREEIKDIVSYLRIIANRKDDAALLRMMNKPARKIGKTTQDAIEKYANDMNVSVVRALKNIEDISTVKKAARGSVESFMGLLDHFELRAEEMKSLSSFVKYVIDHTGLAKMYRERAEKSEEEQDRVENIEEFIRMIEIYMTENPGKKLLDFLQDMSLLTDVKANQQGPNQIRMLTIHSSKGLEFPVVFCPGWNESVFPGWRAFSPDDIAEERRLGYVALSRAEKILEVTCVRERQRANGKGTETLEPSRFISEIPEELKEEFVI